MGRRARIQVGSLGKGVGSFFNGAERLTVSLSGYFERWRGQTWRKFGRRNRERVFPRRIYNREATPLCGLIYILVSFCEGMETDKDRYHCTSCRFFDVFVTIGVHFWIIQAAPSARPFLLPTKFLGPLIDPKPLLDEFFGSCRGEILFNR